MNLQNFLTEVAAWAIGGAIAAAFAYYLFKSQLQRCMWLKSSDVKKEEQLQLLPLRLQAHERLIVFIERINPTNLFIRLHQQGISTADLQSIVLTEIRAEYQHNVAQQLYINTEVWNVIRKLKDDTLAMVNNAVNGLPDGAEGVDLSRKILQHMAGMVDNPYELTLDLIKKDIHQLF